MYDDLGSLVSVAAIVLAVWGAGRPIQRLLLAGSEDGVGQCCFAIGLGLATWSVQIAVLIEMRCWSAPLASMLTLIAAVWGVFEIAWWRLNRTGVLEQVDRRLAPWPGELLTTTSARLARRGGDAARRAVAAQPLILPAAIVALATLGATFVPPTAGAPEADVLATAHRIAVTGSAQTLSSGLATPGVIASLVNAWAQSLDGPVAVGHLNWLLGVFLSAAIIPLAAPILGARSAVMAALLAFLAPAVIDRLTLPSEDLVPAILLALSAAAWWRGSAEFGGLRWFVAATILAAAAIGPIWILPGAVATMVVHRCGRAWSAGNPQARQSVAVWCSTATMIACAMTCYALTGQPLRPIGRNAVALLSSTGPLLIAAAPGLCWVRRLRGCRQLSLGLVALIVVGGFWVPRAAGLLLVPMLAIAATWVWLELARFPRAPQIVARGALGCLAIALALSAWHHSAGWWQIVFKRHGRDTYLASQFGGYRAMQLANEILHAGDVLMSCDQHGYWCRFPVVDGRTLEQEFQTNAADVDGEPASNMLRGLGCTHLLLVDPPPTAGSNNASRLTRLVDDEIAAHPDGQLLPLVEYTHRGPGGPEKRYRLIAVRRLPSDPGEKLVPASQQTAQPTTVRRM